MGGGGDTEIIKNNKSTGDKKNSISCSVNELKKIAHCSGSYVRKPKCRGRRPEPVAEAVEAG